MKDHPLVKVLRNSLFHVTSLDAYRLIRAEGFIKPNPGSRDFTYPQSTTSRCSLLNAVSLFDFAVTDDKLFQDDIHIGYWFDFLVRHKPINLIIRLQRELLIDKIIPYEEAKKRIPQPAAQIEHVEVCHAGDILLNTVEDYIFVCTDEDTIFQIVSKTIFTDEESEEACNQLKHRLLDSGTGWQEGTAIGEESRNGVGASLVMAPDGKQFIIKSPPKDNIGWYRWEDKVLFHDTHMVIRRDECT